MPLTPEQMQAVEAVREGRSLKIEAVAGAGKTHTLAAAARAREGERKLYLVYNRDMATAARHRLPEDTRVMTLNALAFRAIVQGTPYGAKWKGGHVGVATVLRRYGEVARPYARAALDTLERFFNSADPEPAAPHLPPGVEPEDREEVLVLAEALWAAMRDPADDFPLTHGAYVKLWQERKVPIPADVLFVDEAQDLNPVLVDALSRFEGQLVLVGDPHQQIYGFRGAVNAMEAFGLPTVRLSRSFRFGPAVARLAQRVLRYGGRKVEVRGAGETRVSRFLSPARTPFTVLMRTNLGVLAEGLRQAGRPLHLVGDWRDALNILLAMSALRRGRSTDHPLLKKHRNYKDLRAAAFAERGRAWLRPYVELLETWGRRFEERAALLVDSLVAEGEAEVLISTLHRAKGAEWDRVRIGSDFRLPSPEALRSGNPAAAEELNAVYVALTRPRKHLDLTANREVAA